MVELFLSKPAVDDTSSYEDAVKERMSLLQRVETIIWSVLTSAGKYEARLWLCNTISCVRSITPSNQHHLFMELLRSKRSKRHVAAKLIRMIFEKRPEKVGYIIAKRSNMLEIFFEGNPQRILHWFDHFASTSESGHKKGARALSQFAFIHRDVCWDELEWKGKHGQSPAVVATKPHYFHDLDVLGTVENFLENVPEFWSSDELAFSVKDGQIFLLDPKFFVDQFIHLMYKEDLEDVWSVIDEFLTEEKFSLLSEHVVTLLDGHELYAFMNSLSKVISKKMPADFEYPSSWLEILLSMQSEQIQLNDFLLLNAVIAQGRKLVHLLDDEEHEEERERIKELLTTDPDISGAVHWSLMKECSKMKLQVAMKLIGLQSWIIHYLLFKECKTKESCESLLSRSGIHYERSDDYSLVHSDESSKDSDDDYSNSRKKGKIRKKKRRKNYTYKERNVDELLEFEASYIQGDFPSLGGSWLLSTDGYSFSWNLADLPEHLSRHCFTTWMKLFPVLQELYKVTSRLGSGCNTCHNSEEMPRYDPSNPVRS